MSYLRIIQLTSSIEEEKKKTCIKYHYRTIIVMCAVNMRA